MYVVVHLGTEHVDIEKMTVSKYDSNKAINHKQLLWGVFWIFFTLGQGYFYLTWSAI